MLYPSAHVSCSVERRGVPLQQFQVRTCVINECALASDRPWAICACVCIAELQVKPQQLAAH